MKPTTVAFLRSLVIAALAAAVPAVISIVQSNADALKDTWWLPLVLIVLRNAEGIVDTLKGQATQVPFGGGPANPAAYVTHSGAEVVTPQSVKELVEQGIKDAMHQAAAAMMQPVPSTANPGAVMGGTLTLGSGQRVPGTSTTSVTEIPVTHVADEMGPEGTIGADGVLQAVPVEVPVDTEPHAS